MAIDYIDLDDFTAYRREIVNHFWRNNGLLPWTDSRVFRDNSASIYRIIQGERRLHVTVPPDSGTRWVLGKLGIKELLKNYSEDVPAYAQRDYDLYITTDWLQTSDGVVYRFKADAEAGVQYVWRSTTRSWDVLADGYITPDDLSPATWRDLPSAVRHAYMLTLASSITDPDLRRRHKQTVESLSVGRIPFGRIHWRGRWLHVSQYSTLKAAFREFADMLADPDKQDGDTMAEILQDVSEAGGPVSDMHALWNRECEIGNEVEYAEGCGHYHTGDNETVHGGSEVCPNCFEEFYVLAVDINEYINEDSAHYYDGEYHYYEEEDDYLSDDDDDDDYYTSSVRGYSDDVRHYCGPDTSITSSVYGEFLMGIELEVEPSREYARAAAEETAEDLEDYAILKRDGSLSDRGFEIVTAPRGLAEHIRRFKAWEPHSALRSWDNGKCGMHVHISSQAFTQATLGKFIEFINARENDDFIEAIAGRHPRSSDNCRQYCQREGTVHPGNPKATLTGKNTSRYYMVNVANCGHSEALRLGLTTDHCHGRGFNTVELRIFRGTLKKERLLAQIEFAHAAVMFCRFSSFRALTGREFLVWLQGMAGQYPHLSRWFGVRANKKEIEQAPAVRETADV